MRRLLLLGLLILGVCHVHAAPVPADDILAFVRTKLPSDPIGLTGTLKVKTERGRIKTNLPVTMNLKWGATVPAAEYRIGDETLNIQWNSNKPNYTFSNADHKPTSTILDTGLTWADLSFSVLWWPDAKLVTEAKKINRDCYVVDVPVPGSDQSMRLWIEKKMGMLLEAQTRDVKGKEIRLMKIKSIKKIDGMWIAKDLEITDRQSGNKTILQVTDLKREKQAEPQATQTAFDPAESINQFTFELYRKLSGKTTDNLFFSPYSISSALAMTYGGARGDTANEMEQTLHFSGQGVTHPAFAHLRKKMNAIQKKDQIQLNIANSLWPQEDYTFLPDYLAMSREFYESTVESVNYKTDAEAARLKINGWVEDKTNDRIKDLIPEGILNEMTRLVLVNAIYFKGNWSSQFKPEHTHPAPFTLSDGKTVEVPMMSQTTEFRIAVSNNFKALEIPYEGNDLSMLIILPSQSDGLPALEKMVSQEMISSLQFNKTKLRIQLPKFKMESSFSLKDSLSALGMPLAFTNQADFSGMDGTRYLKIGAVVHKAFVEVNEEGTEAAAATGVVMITKSMPMQFSANHPFLFLIRDNSSGVILFIGKMMDPSK